MEDLIFSVSFFPHSLADDTQAGLTSPIDDHIYDWLESDIFKKIPIQVLCKHFTGESGAVLILLI